MHTEAQAKELFCPMVRAANGNQATNCAVNQAQVAGHGNDWNTCAGSRCAMWRWNAPVSRYAGDARTGYCGLAGPGCK